MSDTTPTAEEAITKALRMILHPSDVSELIPRLTESVLTELREAGFYVGPLKQVGWIDENRPVFVKETE